MTKLLYRPFALVFGILGGMLAGAVYKKTWTRISGQDDVPSPKRSEHSWKVILPAALLQGAVFGLVKAAADRGGARAFEKVTGSWPGD